MAVNSKSVPDQSRVVIIGAGIIGCSIAYHLTKLGWKDVSVFERKTVACGTTWHAAGLVGQIRATRNLTKLAKYTADLFKSLESETGQATGFKQDGSVSFTAKKERMEEYKRLASMARSFDVEVSVVTPSEIKKLCPIVNTDDLIGGLYLPKEGRTNPVDTTQAYVKGAQNGGAKFYENTKVDSLVIKNNKLAGVQIGEKIVKAEYVVIACGMWSYEFGKQHGVNIPLHACEHYYMLTEPSDEIDRNLPTLRDHDNGSYYKEDAGKLLLGAFEKKAIPWPPEGKKIPDDFSFDELPGDLDHFQPILEQAVKRVPILERLGMQTFFCGPESFTPDDRYMIGETSETKNLFVAAGLNSIGIQSSGGIGKVVSEWIVGGYPPMDIWDVNILRMLPFQSDKKFLRERVTESLGLSYQIHFPYKQYESARTLRLSSIHEELKNHGACFGESAGWERANWFAPGMKDPQYEYTYGKPNWFDFSKAEHEATRNNVGLFEQSSFAKFVVSGPDSESFLNRISANNISVNEGKIVYTQWLNERGGIEADLTITKISNDSFMIVTGSASQVKDFSWLHRNKKESEKVMIKNITDETGVLSLMGPNSRKLLSQITNVSLENESFPFGLSKKINIANVEVRASRVTYVGELGWEMYMPMNKMPNVYKSIIEIGKDYKMLHCGYHALNSLRLEKGYCHWGHDIGDEETPLEAGLGFAVSYDKDVDFIGKEALLKQKKEGIKKRRLNFAIENPDIMLYHDEPIWVNGDRMGEITSAMFCHTIGSSVGLGLINCPDGFDSGIVDSGDFEIEVACEKYKAKASLSAFYDPKRKKILV